MKWQRKGFLFKPDPSQWWMRSHGMIPTVFKLRDDFYRIYFSGRDDNNRSHIGSITVEVGSDLKVVEVSPAPHLAPGRLGTFDDNGVTPSCVVKDGDNLNLYYIGWNPGSTTRMHIFGGLAISQDGGKTFTRWSEAPIIERNRVNPFINTAPFVLKRAEGDWLMYYVSGVQWVHKDLPRYNIQMATSGDGRHWEREGKVCIDFAPGENALARPYVLFENGTYKMWFASKGEAYKLQYAESEDGVNWERKAIELTGAHAGDDQMAEYGVVIKSRAGEFLLYNGNDYGREGILYAARE